METIGRTWRIRVGLGIVAVLAGGLGVWSLRPLPASAPTSAGAPPPGQVAAAPLLDLARLHSLDHLVLASDPILDLRAPAPVGAGPVAPSVPEPAPLWILGFAALYTLYLPARSW